MASGPHHTKFSMAAVSLTVILKSVGIIMSGSE